MSRWFLYLLLSPLMTPQERADTRAYYKAQRKAFCERYLIAGPELSKELDEIDRQLDEEEDRR